MPCPYKGTISLSDHCRTELLLRQFVNKKQTKLVLDRRGDKITLNQNQELMDAGVIVLEIF